MKYEIDLDLDTCLEGVVTHLHQRPNEEIADVAERVIDCAKYHSDNAEILVDLLKRQLTHVQDEFFELWAKSVNEVE